MLRTHLMAHQIKPLIWMCTMVSHFPRAKATSTWKTIQVGVSHSPRAKAISTWKTIQVGVRNYKTIARNLQRVHSACCLLAWTVGRTSSWFEPPSLGLRTLRETSPRYASDYVHCEIREFRAPSPRPSNYSQ